MSKGNDETVSILKCTYIIESTKTRGQWIIFILQEIACIWQQASYKHENFVANLVCLWAIEYSFVPQRLMVEP